MRIGEVAALVGVTPRAVRHYHHLGLLPEPQRRGNGYRDYGLRDAVLLARIRRLTELGVGLDEVRDVLADAEGHDLREVLEELDADLARQEADIRERRTRLASLLVQAQDGSLLPEGPVSPELSDLLAALGDLRDLGDSPMAVKDREHLEFLDAATPKERRVSLMAALQEMREHAGQVYSLLDGLAGQEPDGPHVARAASALAALLPDSLATHIPGTDAHGLAEALYEDLAPAQAAAVHRALELVKRRQEGPA
ncbi:MerR family transcriptional regulator [Streptomyces xylophagus]|uniref:MerR family transcriptional regulator n=1 Tax=Streptomyces xylophagus TaxID=285514 RepID=UPI0005BA74E6|nr:MerR family transcriptional regulator [Streptomyces xylophagus]